MWLLDPGTSSQSERYSSKWLFWLVYGETLDIVDQPLGQKNVPSLVRCPYFRGWFIHKRLIREVSFFVSEVSFKRGSTVRYCK